MTPADWDLVPLRELGVEIRKSVKPLPGVEYEMYSVPAFRFGEPEILDGQDIKSSKRETRPGDLLLCKINPRINRVWWVDEPGDGRLQLASSEYLVLRLHDKSQELLKYVVWYLRSPGFRRWIELNVEGATGSHTRAKSGPILDQAIPIAPKKERELVVDEIERQSTRLDSAEELLMGSQTKVRRCRSAAMEQALTPEERSWNLRHMGDLLHGIDGGKSFRCEPRPASPEEWGVLKVSAVTWGTYKETEQKALPPSASPLPELEVRPGDLLLSRANTVDYVGRTSLVETTRPRLLLSDKTLRLRLTDEVLPSFLHLMMRTRFVRRQIEAVATGTSDSMRNISQAKIRDLLVPVPPMTIQENIVRELSRLLSVMEHTEQELGALLTRSGRLREQILVKAFSGQLIRIARSAA